MTVEAGAAVFHEAFGRGIVTATDGGSLFVSFGSMKELEKRFQVPGAFQAGFLGK